MRKRKKENAEHKFYAVLEGSVPGVYSKYKDAEKNTKDYPKSFMRKFSTREEAEKYFEEYKAKHPTTVLENVVSGIYTDIKCFSNPGAAIFKSVQISDSEIKIIENKELPNATSNIAEFLAVVDALIYCQQHNLATTIYSKNSLIIGWVKRKVCTTKLGFTKETSATHKQIEKAINWLKSNTYPNIIAKYSMNPEIESVMKIAEKQRINSVSEKHR